MRGLTVAQFRPVGLRVRRRSRERQGYAAQLRGQAIRLGAVSYGAGRVPILPAVVPVAHRTSIVAARPELGRVGRPERQRVERIAPEGEVSAGRGETVQSVHKRDAAAAASVL